MLSRRMLTVLFESLLACAINWPTFQEKGMPPERQNFEDQMGIAKKQVDPLICAQTLTF